MGLRQKISSKCVVPSEGHLMSECIRSSRSYKGYWLTSWDGKTRLIVNEWWSNICKRYRSLGPNDKWKSGALWVVSLAYKPVIAKLYTKLHLFNKFTVLSGVEHENDKHCCIVSPGPDGHNHVLPPVMSSNTKCTQMKCNQMYTVMAGGTC